MSAWSAFAAQSYRFIAVDVETANSDCASLCQIGLAGVTAAGEIRSFACDIDPRDRFSPFNIRIHGINAARVAGAETFAPVYHRIAPLLASAPLIQHSGFDRRAITAACRLHQIDPPDWHWTDSVTLARAAWPEFRGAGGHGLGHLKARLRLEFTHHDAGEDARAAAMVVLLAEERLGWRFTEPPLARQGARPARRG